MERLVEVLKERDIPLEQDDVQWAFESAKTKDDAVRWVEEYLTEPNLLSRDELELYEQIKKGASAPADDILPVYDRELHTTIQQLEESTSAIEAHAKTLSAQLSALRALQTRRESSSRTTNQSESTEQRKRAQDSDRIKFATEDARAQLVDDTASTQKSLKTATASLVASTTHRLNSDDRTIAAIEKLLPNVESKAVDPDRSASVEKWCAALAAFQAAELKARVQTTYENALRDAMDAGDVDGEGNLSVDRKALEDELTSLYDEIASVTKMVVDYEMRTPILKNLELAERESRREQREWSRYITKSFKYLTARLDTINDHASDLVAFRDAISTVSKALSEIEKQNSILNASPAKQFTSAYSSPVKLAKSTSVAPPETASLLLRHVDVQLRDPSASAAQVALETASNERSARLLSHFATSETSLMKQLASTLDESDVQAVSNAVFANTQFDTVHLSSTRLAARLQEVERGISEIGEGLAVLDAGRSAAERKKTDEFIDRWAG